MGKERNRNFKAARPVGHPGAPDTAAMNKGELEERRATIEKLRGFAEKAQEGIKERPLSCGRSSTTVQALRGVS